MARLGTRRGSPRRDRGNLLATLGLTPARAATGIHEEIDAVRRARRGAGTEHRVPKRNAPNGARRAVSVLRQRRRAGLVGPAVSGQESRAAGIRPITALR